MSRFEDMRDRYGYKYVPLAKRDDNDDVLCYMIDGGTKVFVVHDFASSGYEVRGDYESVRHWLVDAIGEMFDFC